MSRRHSMSACSQLAVLCAALCAGPVFAQGALEDILDGLKRQNYSEIHVKRTLLGRIRVTARGAPGTREIILNPATGAVLRDHANHRPSDAGPDTPRSNTPRPDTPHEEDPHATPPPDGPPPDGPPSGPLSGTPKS